MSRGFILWFTGLSGAGKSTLATAVAAALAPRPIEILDGDEVRTHLSRGLSYSREDRDTNVHRIAYVARLLASHGVGVITAAISPYRETRAAVRQLAAERDVAFVEVYANASLDAVVERDVKGLYAKALAGELPHFTGVSDPYEPPLAPDVEAFTDREPIATSVARIVGVLRARGLIEVRSPVDARFDASDSHARSNSHDTDARDPRDVVLDGPDSERGQAPLDPERGQAPLVDGPDQAEA